MRRLEGMHESHPQPTWEDVNEARSAALVASERAARLEEAVLDIDAHATPMGEDGDGFVTGGYLISVGCLHRALGVVGHTAPRCKDCEAQAHDCRAVLKATISDAAWACAYRELLEAVCAERGINIDALGEPGKPAANFRLLVALGLGRLAGLTASDAQ